MLESKIGKEIIRRGRKHRQLKNDQTFIVPDRLPGEEPSHRESIRALVSTESLVAAAGLTAWSGHRNADTRRGCQGKRYTHSTAFFDKPGGALGRVVGQAGCQSQGLPQGQAEDRMTRHQDVQGLLGTRLISRRGWVKRREGRVGMEPSLQAFRLANYSPADQARCWERPIRPAAKRRQGQGFRDGHFKFKTRTGPPPTAQQEPSSKGPFDESAARKGESWRFGCGQSQEGTAGVGWKEEKRGPLLPS